MKYKSFKDYLQTRHAQQAVNVLDDDMPDDYERWLTELSIDEWIEYSNKYSQICAEQAYRDGASNGKQS